MPVEIRELQITTVIQDKGTTSQVPNANSAQQGSSDDIIAKCVEQVLEILKEKLER